VVRAELALRELFDLATRLPYLQKCARCGAERPAIRTVSMSERPPRNRFSLGVLQAHTQAAAATATAFLDSLQQRMPFPIRPVQIDSGSQSRTEEWEKTTTRFTLTSRSAISSGSGIQNERSECVTHLLDEFTCLTFGTSFRHP
jgi:hypothetical protein